MYSLCKNFEIKKNYELNNLQHYLEITFANLSS